MHISKSQHKTGMGIASCQAGTPHRYGEKGHEPAFFFLLCPHNSFVYICTNHFQNLLHKILHDE